MNAENKQDILHVGVSKNPDGSLDFSRAAAWVQSGVDKLSNEYQKILSHKEETLVLPDHWTTLYHGSNLSRPQWQGERRALLDAPTLTINQGTGLSVISDAEKKKQETEKQDLRKQGMSSPSGGTTESYASVSGLESEPLEIQIAFPEIHDRLKGSEEVAALYRGKYGVDATSAMLRLSNATFWKNHQSGRHPVLARGTVLYKLHDSMRADGVRVVQYVPDSLKEMYMQEMTNMHS